MNRIRELRERSGMTQRELGVLLNVKGGAVSKYEKGQIEIGVTILEKLSEIFGVSIDYIVNNPNANLVPPPPPPSGKDTELVEMSKKLDSENYKVAVKMLRLLSENAERNRQQHFSDDEVSLINDYRILSNDNKRLTREMVGKLKPSVQGHLPLGNGNHVEVGTITAPTNVTATQNVEVPK